MEYDYENIKRVIYGEGATFIPVCEECRRFVKADEEITFDALGQPKGPNATCSKHGRIQMLFEGHY